MNSLIEVLFLDKHSFYVLFSYLAFLLGLSGLVIFGYYQTHKLKKYILDMDYLRKNKSQI